MVIHVEVGQRVGKEQDGFTRSSSTQYEAALRYVDALCKHINTFGNEKDATIDRLNRIQQRGGIVCTPIAFGVEIALEIPLSRRVRNVCFAGMIARIRKIR